MKVDTRKESRQDEKDRARRDKTRGERQGKKKRDKMRKDGKMRSKLTRRVDMRIRLDEKSQHEKS